MRPGSGRVPGLAKSQSRTHPASPARPQPAHPMRRLRAVDWQAYGGRSAGTECSGHHRLVSSLIIPAPRHPRHPPRRIHERQRRSESLGREIGRRVQECATGVGSRFAEPQRLEHGHSQPAALLSRRQSLPSCSHRRTFSIRTPEALLDAETGCDSPDRNRDQSATTLLTALKYRRMPDAGCQP